MEGLTRDQARTLCEYLEGHSSRTDEEHDAFCALERIANAPVTESGSNAEDRVAVETDGEVLLLRGDAAKVALYAIDKHKPSTKPVRISGSATECRSIAPHAVWLACQLRTWLARRDGAPTEPGESEGWTKRIEQCIEALENTKQESVGQESASHPEPVGWGCRVPGSAAPTLFHDKQEAADARAKGGGPIFPVYEHPPSLTSHPVISAADIERIAEWGAIIPDSDASHMWTPQDDELLERIEAKEEVSSACPRCGKEDEYSGVIIWKHLPQRRLDFLCAECSESPDGKPVVEGGQS